MDLTVQLLCRAHATGVADTVASVRSAQRAAGLAVEIQLVPWQLTTEGLHMSTALCAMDPQMRWIMAPGQGWATEAAALNRATGLARGRWIWWLEAGDRLDDAALLRWSDASARHPQALLIAGEGEELGENGACVRRFHTLPSSSELGERLQQQLFCPGAVSWNRHLRPLLGLLPEPLTSSYRELWLLQALERCGERLVVAPEVWVRTHQLSDWQQPGRCRRRALEFTEQLADRWGQAPGELLHRYGLQLQCGEAQVSAGSTALQDLEGALVEARHCFDADTWRRLWVGWGLDQEIRPLQQRVEGYLAAAGLQRLWCVTLLRNLLHPELGSLHLGSPWGPHVRLAERLLSPELWSQYRLLRQDGDLIALLNRPVEGVPLPALLHWLGNPSLQRRFPPAEGLEAFAGWWAEHGAACCPHLRLTAAGTLEAEPWLEDSAASPEQRPFGVNLIGHAFEVFGIGEDVRMAAVALESADVPYCVVNVPANNGAAASDRSLEAQTLAPGELGPYRFNLVCLAAPSHGAWIAREGLAQQRGRTTIVAWPWETQTWPVAWDCMMPLADAFWPSSLFTAQALEPFSDPVSRPLQVMPMTVHIDHPEHYRQPQRRRATRERWGLDPEARLVLFVFDVKSSLARKNPWAALEAFQRAFPSDGSEQVQLVIKALRPPTPNAEWMRLQEKAAEDPRLRVIEADLEREELLELMGCCDVFLSLHRSEGFGRGIAEAGILGLQVVASAFGGNVDFCLGEGFHLVPCTPWRIPAGAYAQGEGHLWGDPDLQVAGELLRQGLHRQALAPAEQLQELSSPVVGERYRLWLEKAARL
jgi:glycosyltransferase involved in cell wall biosynthesis